MSSYTISKTINPFVALVAYISGAISTPFLNFLDLKLMVQVPVTMSFDLCTCYIYSSFKITSTIDGRMDSQAIAGSMGL